MAEETRIVKGRKYELNKMGAKTKKIKKTQAKETKITEVVKKVAEELLQLMGTSAKVDVSEDKDNEAILVDLDAKEEAGLLIGARGETLGSLQTIIGMIVRQKTGDWHRVLVNISDWRERQTERLESLARQVADRAKDTGEPQPLYNLNAAQRRIVHLALSKDEEIETESMGEGRERYLIVRLKKK